MSTSALCGLTHWQSKQGTDRNTYVMGVLHWLVLYTSVWLDESFRKQRSETTADPLIAEIFPRESQLCTAPTSCTLTTHCNSNFFLSTQPTSLKLFRFLVLKLTKSRSFPVWLFMRGEDVVHCSCVLSLHWRWGGAICCGDVVPIAVWKKNTSC